MDTSQFEARLTIGQVIGQIFPEGTCLPGTAGRRRSDLRKRLARAPDWPPDLFGVAAYLLHEAGFFQAVVADDQEPPGNGAFGIITEADRDHWCGVGKRWAKGPVLPTEVQGLWDGLLQHADRPLRQSRDFHDQADKDWMRCCLALLAIADEACAGVGFGVTSKRSWVGVALAELNAVLLLAAEQRESDDGYPYSVPRPMKTITDMTSTEYFTVQPKSRTPQVGATTRTLSHNLALLPPHRRLSARWSTLPLIEPDSSGPTNLPAGDPAAKDQNLNLLLVPFPYEIPLEAFAGKLAESSPPAWGWFELDSAYWLDDPTEELTSFVLDLAIKAHESLPKGQPLHGVILPELSIGWKHHLAIAGALAAIPDLGVRFLVTGTTTNCDGDKGNFEVTTTFGPSATGVGPSSISSSSRPKHHRWRLSDAQVEDYELEKRLLPSVFWWEKIELRERAVHTHAFGRESHFTVLICEDLARADPVHEMVRALGPSLVICLLMDSAQLPQRWPGRYALSLSEDPGSSVLTLTSRALLARSNRVRARRDMGRTRDDSDRLPASVSYASQTPQSWAVALWRDEKEGSVELHCPPGEHAILLRLTGQPVSERTFDGRLNKDSIRWVYHDAMTLRLDRAPPPARLTGKS